MHSFSPEHHNGFDKMTQTSPSISILILTLNEQSNIEAVLDSVRNFKDVVVYDSYSIDNTVAIAEERGARIVQRKFDNWATHQNWALANIEFLNPWVFYLDADERMTPSLEQEIAGIATDPADAHVGYYCGRDNYFMGRLIRRCYPPVPILRFFKPQHVTYERLVNPVAHVDGPVGQLRQRFLHYNFSKGLTEWIDKHNKYSLAEAMEALRVADEGTARVSGLFHGDKAARRAALKRLAWRLPMRPWLKFFWLYCVRGGFLDGWPGLVYCRLQAIYEYFIVLKVKELRLKRQGRPL
jgi:glycosyltransferase involved in cell wall biosynthesis